MVFIEYKSQLDIELVVRDSIRNTTYETYCTHDSLLAISTNYIEALSICFGNGDSIAYNSNEQQFYELLCRELKTSKDEYLMSLIVDALDLQCIFDARNLELQCRSENK